MAAYKKLRCDLQWLAKRFVVVVVGFLEITFSIHQVSDRRRVVIRVEKWDEIPSELLQANLMCTKKSLIIFGSLMMKYKRRSLWSSLTIRGQGWRRRESDIEKEHFDNDCWSIDPETTSDSSH